MSDPTATKDLDLGGGPSVGRGMSRAGIMAALPIIAIVMIGVAGHAAGSLKPLIIQAFVQAVGFDKATSGYLLATEMIATSAGSIVATAFPFALRRRPYLFAALALMMVANLASISFKQDPGTVLYALRALSGFGAGFGLGRLGILIALSGRPGKTAALYSTSTQLYGAVAAFAMPFIDRLCGANSIFIILAGTVPLGLILIGWIPESNERITKNKATSIGDVATLGLGEKIILATTFGVFYLGVGTFWPFISVLGETTSIGHAQMSAVIGWAAIASALGAASAVFAGDRKSSAPIITSFFILLCVSVTMQLVAPRSLPVFVTSVLLFAFAYWVINPMILGVMSKLDKTGQMNGVYYIVAVAGISAGPALAGWVLAHGSDRFTSSEFLRVVSLALLAVSSAIQIYYAFRARRIPD
ncbi:MFS transporter [Paraburkholderia largidicola]|uniref:MFS transporter n=1 Tax=Paraburkholderia largidicola TaxID=3014751 RepID=A0A7I8BL19_9BURK|nr:MFS transporter [Paraburkholderia sp. PGU16]BCF89068.1 MFS transporter [Paraburkholderia sp. PGU16]